MSFWAIFCSFTPLLTPKIKIWNKCKKPWRYYPNTYVYHKWRSYDVWCLRYKPRQTRVLVILGYFLSFDPPKNLKNQSIKKIKQKTWRYYYFALACHKLWPYDVWFLIYGVRQTELFVILDYFFPEIWCVRDGIMFHFGLYFALLPL